MEVPAGAICVLLGPSGCGKTTTMKMINRLIAPTSGKIFIDGTRHRPASTRSTLRRSIGYVIQQIGLFPNKTVEENICVVPDLLGWDRAKSRKRAAELLEMVNLEPATFLKRYPKELSGGQQQRVGVVRALAADPPVLLMDEPFGAIDPINREVIQDEFMKLQAELKKTIVFVSHDIDEAVKMACKSRSSATAGSSQYDTPNNMLANPVNAFVADFVGSDRTLKRLRLIKVADAMMANAPSVRAEDTLETAIALHERARPRLDRDGRSARPRARHDPHRAGARTRRARSASMSSRCPASINVKEDLRNAVSLMFTHGVTWLACVDDDGFYKGYVTQRSITQLLGATYAG